MGLQLHLFQILRNPDIHTHYFLFLSVFLAAADFTGCFSVGLVPGLDPVLDSGFDAGSDLCLSLGLASVLDPALAPDLVFALGLVFSDSKASFSSSCYGYWNH